MYAVVKDAIKERHAVEASYDVYMIDTIEDCLLAPPPHTPPPPPPFFTP